MYNYVIFVDGVCNLCNNLVRFVYRFDKNNRFAFASLDSNYLKNITENTPDLIKDDTVIVYSNNENKFYYKSEAIKIVLLNSNIFLKMIGLTFHLFPLKFKDYIYNLVANYRYKLFGKTEYCSFKNNISDERFIL
jgi:predicted DCC family thiol-disulfide oxidoreductase YuxK